MTAARHDRAEAGADRLTSEQVWHAVSKASFAVVSYVTPAGEPRSSGVVYATARRASCRVLEIIPEGQFLTYGLGVSLAQMRSPAAARARGAGGHSGRA